MKYVLIAATLFLCSCKNDNTTAKTDAALSEVTRQATDLNPTKSPAEVERERLIDAFDQKLTNMCFADVTNRLLIRFYVYPDGHADGWKFVNGKTIKNDPTVTEAMDCAMKEIGSTKIKFGELPTSKGKKPYFLKIN